MPIKYLQFVFVLFFSLICNGLNAQTSIINFEFSDDEKLLLITGGSDAEQLILDLYVKQEDGSAQHLGGLEVFPMNDAFGFSIGIQGHAKWPKGSYQLAAANFANSSDVTYANANKAVGNLDFPSLSALIILPFVDTYWIPTLDAPNVPDEWVKPCPSHIMCTVIDGPDVEPFSPPLSDDEGTDP